MEKLKETGRPHKFTTLNALQETKSMVKQLSAISGRPIYIIIAELVKEEYEKVKR
jgi:hypothetical protein